MVKTIAPEQRHLWTQPGVDDIIRYESGEMDEDEMIEFFQRLINTGMIHHLQGHYGRVANDLLRSGLITDPYNR